MGARQRGRTQGVGAVRRAGAEGSPVKPLPEGAKRWGNVARRGARAVGRSEDEHRARGRDDRVRVASEAPAPADRWVRQDGRPEWGDRPVRAPGSSGPGPRRIPYEPKPLPAELSVEIRKAATTATAHHREVLVGKMADAAAAYERHRFGEAARLAKQVVNEAPNVIAVRELAGLAAYRAGRWREAIAQLDAYGHLTGDLEHVPVLMDCHRALGKPRKVASMWSELRLQSPDPDVLAEARMVAAGMLADRRDLEGAIALLVGSGAARKMRNPSDRHIRQWYVLGDLYERGGELPKARDLFQRILAAAPDAYDVADRLASLGDRRRVGRPGRATRTHSVVRSTGPAPRPSKGSDRDR